MRIVRRSLAVILAALLVAPAAQAQTHVVARTALARAVQERVSQDQADRDAILALLAAPKSGRSPPGPAFRSRRRRRRFRPCRDRI